MGGTDRTGYRIFRAGSNGVGINLGQNHCSLTTDVGIDTGVYLL